MKMKPNNDELREKAIELSSFLEAMLLGESVNKKQVEAIKRKVDEIVSIILGEDFEDYEESDYEPPTPKRITPPSSNDLTEPLDDLPF